MLKRSPPLDFSQHSTHPHPFFLLRKYPKETGTISFRVSSCLPLNSLSLFSLCGFKAEYRLMLESYLRVGKHFPPHFYHWPIHIEIGNTTKLEAEAISWNSSTSSQSLDEKLARVFAKNISFVKVLLPNFSNSCRDT